MVVNPDDLLPLSRRIDWRFLLPDPALDRVSYAGPDDTLLARALREFSGTLVTGGASVDVAVLVDPSPWAFSQALATARSFYIEFHRPTLASVAKQWIQTGRCLRLARAAGFDSEAYWHHPNFDASNRIIPLSAPGPLLHVVAKNGGGVKALMRNAGVLSIISSRVLMSTVPCLSIAGYRA